MTTDYNPLSEPFECKSQGAAVYRVTPPPAGKPYLEGYQYNYTVQMRRPMNDNWEYCGFGSSAASDIVAALMESRDQSTQRISELEKEVEALKAENDQLWAYAKACYPQAQGPDWESEFPIIQALEKGSK